MNRYRHRLILLLLGAGLLLCSGRSSAAPPAAADLPALPPAPGQREALVDEPVFHGQAYIYEAGPQQGLSVVLIHGVGERGARDWERLIPELAAQYHVVAFDLPGFGRSDRRNELYTPARYAEFVKWVVGRYVKGPLVLIGHSFGGAVALRYAALYPEGMKRLILVDVPGVLHRVAYTKHVARVNSAEWESRLPVDPVDKINDLMRTLLDSFDREDVTKDLGAVLENPALRQTMLGSDPKKIVSIALLLEDFSQAINEMRVPALVIWGEHDPIAPLRTGRVLAAHLPAARLELIGKAGHVPMLDRPEQFNRIVMREIASPPAARTDRTPVRQPLPSDRIGTCQNESGMTFTGIYRLVVISDCKHVRIEDATIGLLDVSGSDVQIDNSRISGADVSLKTDDSEITLTNVIVEGDIAVQASRSRLDLAGVTLSGRAAAVSAKKDSMLIFSVSRVESPHASGYVHGARRIAPDKPL
jgi:pimeloyl-ACP methyl ester carboxylesterase